MCCNGPISRIAVLLAPICLSCGGLAENGGHGSIDANNGAGGASSTGGGEDHPDGDGPADGPQQGSGGGTASKTDRQFTAGQLKSCLQISAIEEVYWEEFREIQNRPDVSSDPSHMDAPPPEGDLPDTPCFFCRETCSDRDDAAQCSHITACVQRHCLCEDCRPARMGGPSMCECVELCMPQGPSVCRDYWDDVMSCRAKACGSVCE